MATAPLTSETPAAAAPDLLEEIARRDELRLRSLSKGYARSVPIASDIDPTSCLRRQVLEIVAWQDKPLPGPGSQARFEIGNLHEREAIARLMGLGFQVVEGQTPFELKRRGSSGEVALRGRTDGAIVWERQRVRFEIKTMNPNIYAQINTAEDFDRYWWTRKYPTQLQSYLVGYGEPWGFLYLTDCLGSWKAIRMNLDLELAERIWTFAESIVSGVQAYRADGTLPDFTSRVSDCSHCDFFGRTCNPPIVEIGARFLQDPELIAEIERWSELRPAAKEYDGLDKRVKKAIKDTGVTRALAGRFAIEVTERPVKGYEVKPRTDRVISIEALTTGAAAADGGAF